MTTKHEKTFTTIIPAHMTKLAEHEITCSQFLFHGMLKLRIVSVDKAKGTMSFQISPCSSYTRGAHKTLGELFARFYSEEDCEFSKDEKRIKNKKESSITETLETFNLEDE